MALSLSTLPQLTTQSLDLLPSDLADLVQQYQEQRGRGDVAELFSIVEQLSQTLALFQLNWSLQYAQSLQDRVDFQRPFEALRVTIEFLKESSDMRASDLLEIFFVGSLDTAMAPRRHSRLLGLSNKPLMGFQSFEAWFEEKPSDRDLLLSSLRKYLPILKEWFVATEGVLSRCSPEYVQKAEGTVEITLKCPSSFEPIRWGGAGISLSSLFSDFERMRVPDELPRLLVTALSRLKSSLFEKEDEAGAVQALQLCLSINLQYFSACSYGIWKNQMGPHQRGFALSERLGLQAKQQLLMVLLDEFSQVWEEYEALNLLWPVFFDIGCEAGSEESFFLHTERLGEPSPQMGLTIADFCQLSLRQTEYAYRPLLQDFLPVLQSWLDSGGLFYFEFGTDFVQQRDDTALFVELDIFGEEVKVHSPGLQLEISPTRWEDTRALERVELSEASVASVPKAPSLGIGAPLSPRSPSTSGTPLAPRTPSVPRMPVTPSVSASEESSPAVESSPVLLRSTSKGIGRELVVTDLDSKPIFSEKSQGQKPVIPVMPEQVESWLAKVQGYDYLPKVLQKIVAGLYRACAEGESLEQRALWSSELVSFLTQYFAGAVLYADEQTGFLPPGARSSRSQAPLFAEDILTSGLKAWDRQKPLGAELLGVFLTPQEIPYLHTSRLGGRHIGVASWIRLQASEAQKGEQQAQAWEMLAVSWLASSLNWLELAEHCFEELDSRNCLEGAVILGDHVVEYLSADIGVHVGLFQPRVLRDEKKEALAREKEAERKADQQNKERASALESIPEGVPANLRGALEKVYSDEIPPLVRASVMVTVFEFLLQYYAGLCGALLKDSLPAHISPFYSTSSNLLQRQKLLTYSVSWMSQNLRQLTPATRSVLEVFVKGEELFLHSRLLGIDLKDTSKTGGLSDWCRGKQQKQPFTQKEFLRALRALKEWVYRSRELWSKTEHFAEPVDETGSLETVVVLEDEFMEMIRPDYQIVLPSENYLRKLYGIRPDSATSAVAKKVEEKPVQEKAPDLVKPDLASSREEQPESSAFDSSGGSGFEDLEFSTDVFESSANINVEEWSQDSSGSTFAGRDEDYDSVILLDEPSSWDSATPIQDKSGKKGQVALGAPVEMGESIGSSSLAAVELGTAILELYKQKPAKKEDGELATKEDKTPPRMVTSEISLGLRTNLSTGQVSHSGRIDIVNEGGGVLKGSVESDHPCLRVQPAAFYGNNIKLAYFVDPSDIPVNGRVSLKIQSQNETKVIKLRDLVPRTWVSYLSKPLVAGLMLLPGILSILYILAGFKWFLMPKMTALIEGAGGLANVDLLSSEISPVVTELNPILTVWGVQFLFVALVVPYLVYGVFLVNLSAAQRSSLAWLVPISLVFPTLGVLGVVYGSTLLDVPIEWIQKDGFSNVNHLTMSLWFVVINVVISVILLFQASGFFDRRLRSNLLKLTLLTAVFLITVALILVVSIYF